MRPWRLARAVLCCIVAVWLLAPLVVVVVISFSSAPFLQFPPPGFSLRWYEQLFSTPAWTNSLLVSVEIMGPAAFFATVLGTAASYALVRGRIPGAHLIMACLMLPLILPAVLSSLLVAMILTFDELIVSLFVSSARVRPVAVQMWSNLLGDFDPTIAAIASVCFLLALLVLLADLALRAGRSSRIA